MPSHTTGPTGPQGTPGVNGLPAGMIMMWSGASNAIPSGWALCNGANGTPNLLDRFVVGAGGSYTPGTTGGTDFVALTVDQMPRHGHPIPNHIHNVRTNMYPTSNSGTYSGTHFSTGTPEGSGVMTGFTTDTTWQFGSPYTNDTGNNEFHENRPPFFALCYVMKL